MNNNDSEKEQLKKSLLDALKSCKFLKVGRHKLESSFTITPRSFLDFTEQKYIDGTHTYKVECTIIILLENKDRIEKTCEVHFDANIHGIEAEIANDLVIVDQDFIPNYCKL